MNATTGTALPYTEEGYMKLGRNLARTFLDYYRLIGYIKDKPAATALPKPTFITSAVNKEKPFIQSSIEGEERFGRIPKSERTVRNTLKLLVQTEGSKHEGPNLKIKEFKSAPHRHSPKI